MIKTKISICSPELWFLVTYKTVALVSIFLLGNIPSLDHDINIYIQTKVLIEFSQK